MCKKAAMMLGVLCMLSFSSTSYCTDLDSINQGTATTVESQTGGDTSEGTGDESYDSVSDVMRGYNAFDGEDMEKAKGIVSPIEDIIGTAIGVILLLTMLGVSVTTAIDLLFLGVPATRGILNPQMQQGGGMPMGMSPGMQGGAQAGGGHKFVSDEAVQALAMSGAGQQAGAQVGGYGGGYGGYGGGYGGAPMGAQQQNQKQKSPMSIYIRRRAFFLILLAIASTLLLSSLFLDCGLNIADLLYKVIDMLNSNLQNVQI